jgi:hypothetical protein
MMATYIERNKAGSGTTPLELSKLLSPVGVDSLPQTHDATTQDLSCPNIPIDNAEKLHWNSARDMGLSEASLTDNSLLAISQSLADQEFTSMDRIVTLDDTTFINWDFS